MYKMIDSINLAIYHYMIRNNYVALNLPSWNFASVFFFFNFYSLSQFLFYLLNRSRIDADL